MHMHVHTVGYVEHSASCGREVSCEISKEILPCPMEVVIFCFLWAKRKVLPLQFVIAGKKTNIIMLTHGVSFNEDPK